MYVLVLKEAQYKGQLQSVSFIGHQNYLLKNNLEFHLVRNNAII